MNTFSGKPRKSLRTVQFSFFFLVAMISAGSVVAQTVDTVLEAAVIRETLPAYLNKNPNSAASYLRHGSSHSRLSKLEELSAVFPDSAERAGLKQAVLELDHFSDSMATVLKTGKIVVHVTAGLHPYIYKPTPYYDLRKEKDWKGMASIIAEDFTYDKLARMDTVVSLEFLPLIRKQIVGTRSFLPFDVQRLDAGYYSFDTTKADCRDMLCMDADKIYRPVFNAAKTKAVYLFSYGCRTGICREFIFAEKRQGKWQFIDSYPSHLVDNADE